MIPIVDAERRIKGIVTHDDIIDVLREEANEDIQKLGGTEALDAPYLQIPVDADDQKTRRMACSSVYRKMLTATAMGYYEHQISRAVVLALFVPLIIRVVLWGTLAGSVLPIVLRLLGFDPASVSAPFVATLVDVTGLIIYLMVATLILTGSLL